MSQRFINLLSYKNPVTKNMTGITTAEYFVYNARVVKKPDNKNSFAPPVLNPFRKYKIDIKKKKRKAASLRPDLEKKRKNSEAAKIIVT